MRKSAVTLLIGVTASLLSACKVNAPGRIETTVAYTAKQVSIGGKDWRNPLPETKEAVSAGAVDFQHYCQVCHGADGHGTGVLFTETMSPPIPDLDDDDIQEYTDGQLKWIIQNGIRFTGMPGWKGIVKDDQMWYMVCYIRHLPERKNASVTRVSRHH